MLFVFGYFIRLDLVPTASVFCASISFLLFVCGPVLIPTVSLFSLSVSFSLSVCGPVLCLFFFMRGPFLLIPAASVFCLSVSLLLLSVHGPILLVIPTVSVFCMSLFHCLCVDLFSVSFSLCMDLFFSVLLHLCFLCPSLFLSFLSACGLVFFLIPTASVFCLCISFLLPVFCASSL